MSESRTAETSASLEMNLERLSRNFSDTKLAPTSALQEKDTEAQDSDDSETLKRVQGKIPKEAWLIASFSGAERFAYFALSAPLQNYIQNPRHDHARPGALGKGESVATALNCFLYVVSYTTPIFAGIIADSHWGPFKTILLSTCVYILGIAVLTLTSIPPALDAGAGLGGLIAALILIGIGVGGVKSSVAPFTADQLRRDANQIVVLDSGERVIVDQELTIRRVYSIFYWCTNIGALSGLASTTMEKYIGFWVAFLLAFVSLAFGISILVLGRSRYYRREPSANFRANLLSALGCAIKGGFDLNHALPAKQRELYGKEVAWDDQFIDDLHQALKACKVWAIYPVVWLCFGQNQTNLVSQAGQMITYGIPNDAMMNLNPIFVLIIVPILEKLVYPYMQKIKLTPRPTVRMTVGFALIAASMAIAAGVQQTIYNAPPCYSSPLDCPASDHGSKPNQVSVMLQVPVYFLGAVGEVFFSVAGSEYAYNKAAPSMKSTLQAVTMFTLAANALLGLAVAPAAHNPYLTILFASFSGTMALTSIIFALLFWKTV